MRTEVKRKPDETNRNRDERISTGYGTMNHAKTFTMTLAVALVLCSTSVYAEINAFFDFQGLTFAYNRTAAPGDTGTIGTFSVETTDISDQVAAIRDGNVILDDSVINDWTDFDFSFTGEISYDGSGYSLNSLGANGNGIAFTDIETSTNAVEADFKSWAVSLSPLGASTHLFSFSGNLNDLGNSNGPILVNRPPGGSTWTFEGDGGESIAIGPPVSNFQNGGLVQIHLTTTETSLDDLFEEDVMLSGGDMKITVVPAPAAVILGLIGLPVVGWIKRRFA
jgi:hypothetical protein